MRRRCSSLALGAGTRVRRHVRRRPRPVRRPAGDAAGAAERGGAERDGLDPAAAGSLGSGRSCPSASSPTRSCGCCGSTPVPPTGSRGRCSPRSTRSSRTSAATWARARPGPSAGCSSCPTPGCAGARTGTATGSPIRGTPTTPIHSAARYLAAANGRTDIARAIFAYNHAQWYVDDVLQLAAMFGGELRERRRRLHARPDGARARAGAGAGGLALRAARRRRGGRVRASAAKSERLAAAAEDLGQLLSDRVLAEKDAFQAGEELRRRHRRGRAAPRPSWRRRRPRSRPPRAAPRRRRSRPRPPASCGCRRGPTATSSPSEAAPASSPSAATTTTIPPPTSPRRSARRSTRSRTASCSRSSTTAAAAPASSSGPLDGLEWVYCHLSYRDPGLEEGLLVSAGQWVGLVGSTGHSTGPHLHLGLRPARYPQEMPWFQEFAGIAFMWQDEPGGGGGPVDAGLRARAARGAGRGRRRIHALGGLSSWPASADRRGMTAGVIGRLPRVGVIVCAIGLVTGTLAFAASSTLSTPRGTGGDARRRQARAARRARRPQAGLRLREGLARAGRLRLAGRGLRARLRRERRRLAVARAGHAGDRRRRSDRRPPPEPERLLRAGGRPRERLPVRRQARPARRLGAAEAARPPRRRPPPDDEARDDGAEGEAAPKAKATPKAKPAKPPARASPPSTSPALRPSRSTRSSLSARAKQLAAWVEKHPHRTRRERRPLALPAQLDRHGRRLRLGRRRRGAADAGRRRRRACRSSGGSAPRASRSPARRSPRSRSARS